MQTQASGRNAARTLSILDSSPPRDAGAPVPIGVDKPGQGGVVVRDARRPRPDVEALVEAPTLLRVLETKKSVDVGGSRSTLPAGKVVSSAHYDLVHLKNQGVKLGAVDQELADLPAGRSESVGDLVASLAALGLRVVPADEPKPAAPPPDVAAQLAAIQEQFAAFKAQSEAREAALLRDVEQLKKRREPKGE